MDHLENEEEMLFDLNDNKKNSLQPYLSMSLERESLPSGFEQTVTGMIEGSAGTITPEKGLLLVKIPRVAVGPIDSIRITVDSSGVFTPLDYYQEGGDIVFPFSFNYEGLDREARIYSFAIRFFVATVSESTTHNVSIVYSDIEIDDNFIISPVSWGKPIFSKLFYGSRKMDEFNNPYGLLNVNTQSETNINKFALLVSYDGDPKRNVVIQDILPEGTTLASNPSQWNATGNPDTIAGGIRILEVTNAGESNNEFHFVSEQFVNKVDFDSQKNTITIDLGDIPENKAYMIEYAIEVVDLESFNNAKDPDGFARNRATMSYDEQVLSTNYRVVIDEDNMPSASLGKFVNKHVVNLEDNYLEYTLAVNVFSGNIPAGVKIEDQLDSRLNFVEFIGELPEFLSAEVEDNLITYTLLQPITEPMSLLLSFRVSTEQLAVGERVANYAELVNGDQRLRTADVITQRIDGRIFVEKVDEEGNKLANAKFHILNRDGIVVEEGITQEDGFFISKPLPIGQYQVLEIEAPEGFLLEQAVHEVFVNEYSVSPVQIRIENRLIPGGVILEKVDDTSGEALSQAVFSLQDREGQVLQSGLTTGADGKLAIQDLAPGEYQLVEIQAPTGYELDETPLEFTIERNQKTVVELVKSNRLIPGGVILEKIDDISGEALSQAVFSLQDREGQVLKSGLTTGADGKLAIQDLAPGEYQLVETQAPTGYELDETPLEFTIERNQKTVVELVKSNRLIPGGVILEKLDDISGQTLSQAVFSLQDREGQVLQSGLTTGADGKLAIQDLAPGEYQLVETQAPTGYELDETPLEFTTERNQKTVVELVKSNRLIPGGVILEKIDDISGQALSQAVFSLQDREGQVLQSGLTTGADGRLAIQDLAPGEYQLVETQAPTGYELDETPLEFTIERNQKTVVELVKSNCLIPGGVILEKIDDISGQTLSQAVFSLQDREGQVLKSGLTTGADGKLAIPDLAPGEYQLVETQAPTGYELDETPLEFTIERNQKAVVELVKSNRLITEPEDEDAILVSEEDGATDNPLPDAGQGILLAPTIGLGLIGLVKLINEFKHKNK